MNYLKFSSIPGTCIFMIWTSRKSFIWLGHATDQRRHLGLIRLRIFKMRRVSFANDHLGPKSLISDSATRRSLWPLECQSVALDDNKWQISKTLIQNSIQTHGQVGKMSYFDIWRFWKSYCWLRLIWVLDHRSRSRSRRSRYILPGAGVGAAEQFYLEPEPEPEPTKNVTAPHPCFVGMKPFFHFQKILFSVFHREVDAVYRRKSDIVLDSTTLPYAWCFEVTSIVSTGIVTFTISHHG